MRSCELSSCLPGHPGCSRPPSSDPTGAAGRKALSWGPAVLQTSGPGSLSRLNCHLPRRPALSPLPPLPSLSLHPTPAARTSLPPALPCPALPCTCVSLPCRSGGRVPAPKGLLTSRSSSGAHSSGPLWSLSNGSGEVAPGSRHPVSLHCTATPCSPSQCPAGSSTSSPHPSCSGLPQPALPFPLLSGCPGTHGVSYRMAVLSRFPFFHPSLYGGLLWGFAFGPNGISVLGNPDVGLYPRPLPRNTPLPTCHLHSVWQASQMP